MSEDRVSQVEKYARRMNYARAEAAKAWCQPATSGIEMDPRLAEAFARILV